MCDKGSIKSLNISESDETIKKPLFPNVHVDSIKGYFDLPKEKREKWGIYLKPFSLPCDLFDEDPNGWHTFYREIRKHYPIQGWIREWFWSLDNPVYAFIHHRIRDMRDIKNNIRHFIRPCHPRFRKAYPRHIWMDITNAVVEVNFAMIQDFWHEEVYPDSFVDWHADPKTEEIYNWLKSAIDWIERARPELQKQCDEELHKAVVSNRIKKLTYEEAYGEHDRLEKLLHDTDTVILNKFVEYREYLWT